MRGPTLCGAAPPLAQACGPTICEAPLYAVPLPPSDYIALDIRFGGERHRIFQCLAYSSATGRCHPPFPEGTSFVSSVCWIGVTSPWGRAWLRSRDRAWNLDSRILKSMLTQPLASPSVSCGFRLLICRKFFSYCRWNRCRYRQGSLKQDLLFCAWPWL